MVPRRKRFGKMLVWLLIALVALGFWYFENYTMVTEEITVQLDALPTGFEGFRIVQISDLHGKTFGNDQERLIKAVQDAQPDIIAITGDLVDNDSQIPNLPTLLHGLTALAPTYYITGNHEWSLDMDSLTATLTACGVVILDNQFVPLTQNGQTILLAGFADPLGPYDQPTPAQVMAQLRQTYGDCTVVGLYHRNDKLEEFASLSVDLLLSGHGHGGIIRLPFIGGLLDTNRNLFPQYDAGLYASGTTQMIVSRGLGGTNGLDFRLFNRPHLPVLVLSGK